MAVVTTPTAVTTPPYVHDILDRLLGDTSRINFHGHAVPDDVHERLLRRTGRPIPGIVTKVLTEREMQTLRGMADGKSNGEIAGELLVSVDTVKTHARRMYQKLGARDRAHAVAVGFRTGLLG